MEKELMVVALLCNDTQHDITLYLEMLGEEVIMSPGHALELMAPYTSDLLPLTFDYVEGGIQVHPYKEFDPDWHVRFNGKLIRAGYPTILAEYA